MKFDCQLGLYDLAALPPEARRLEGIGFDALWSFETQHDPFLPLAYAATATQRLHVGTNIAVAFARQPLATAMVAWDLQRASGGRFLLGLGTQVRLHVERRFSATWDRPAARIADYIRCLRAIWDCWQHGHKPDYRGEFYQFRLMTPFFDPGPIKHPHVPVFLAGVNPAMCRTAGAVADGFHVHPMHSARYLREVVHPALAEGARAAGRDPARIQLMAPVFAVTGETAAQRSEREADVRRQIAFYASTPNYRGVLELHGWADVGERLSALVRRGDWDALAAEVPDAMLDAFAVHAAPDDLPAALAERCDGLLHRISLYHPLPADADADAWRRRVAALHAATGEAPQ